MSGGVKRKSVFIVLILLISTVLVFAPSVLGADVIRPSITIVFAGDTGDLGGSYWRPPGETDVLDEAGEGIWRDGYYTNNSRQLETFILINATVTDDVGVDSVMLHWYNSTANSWDNTSSFTNTGGNYWEINKTGVPYGKFSFDVWATDAASNINFTAWNKTGLGGVKTRRYVYLGCNPINISYTPLYLYNATYTSAGGDLSKDDRLEKDQGTDGTVYDTGFLSFDVPDDIVNHRRCDVFVGYWYNGEVCVMPMTIKKIYFHVWWSANIDTLKLGYDFHRRYLDGLAATDYTVDKTKSRSAIYYNSPVGYNDSFYLETTTKMLSVTRVITDNNIYQMVAPLLYSSTNKKPIIISNRSFNSFILLNTPDNATLNASYPDSDSDSLSDWFELYRSYTNPFLDDTDNDGYNDSIEVSYSKDPNNWTDYPTIWVNHAPVIGVPSPVNTSTGVDLTVPISAVISDADGNSTTVCWWNNATGIWVKYQQNNTFAANATCILMNTTFVNATNTTYWWMVTVDDSHDNVSAIYHFTTYGFYLFEINIASDSDFDIGHGVRYGSGTLANPYMICNWSVVNVSISGTTKNFTISNCSITHHLLISGLSAVSKLVLDGIFMDGTGKGSLCFYTIHHSNTELRATVQKSVFKDLAYSFIGG